MNSNKKIMVSVCMITYNHEAYIREAIEGVLMQKCQCQLELVIGEDCSSDKTRMICEKYAEESPEIIKLLPSEKNLTMVPNFVRTLQACSGKYVAFCEGDDYWTDPLKLQKQVDFLEKNKDAIISFHDFSIVDKYNKHICYGYSQNYKEKLNLKDLIFGYYAKTCTVVFRNDSLRNVRINEIKYVDDSVLWVILLLNSGFACKLNYNMASYRLHEGGGWGLKDEYSKNLQCIKSLESIISLIKENQYSYYSHSQLVALHIQIGNDLLDKKEIQKAKNQIMVASGLLFNNSLYNSDKAIMQKQFYYLFIKRIIHILLFYIRYYNKQVYKLLK